MEEVRINSQKSEEGVELRDLEGSTDSSRLNAGAQSVEAYFDPVADSLLKYYKAFYLDEASTLRYICLASPLSLIVFFYLFVSQSTSSLISFGAFTFSWVFIGVSLWMLCEILKKDVGPRSM